MAAKKLRLKGFKNVHFAPSAEVGTYSAPVHITGGKKVNIELKYESEDFESDDMIDEQEYIFMGGDGGLTIKSLIPEEYELLFGNTVDGGEVAIRTTDIAPNGALLFERQKRNSNHKRLYAIYNTKFAPSAIAAESAGKGGGDIDEELKFAIGEANDNLVVYFLDTDLATPEQLTKISKWYTEVQYPGTKEAGQTYELKQNMKK